MHTPRTRSQSVSPLNSDNSISPNSSINTSEKPIYETLENSSYLSTSEEHIYETLEDSGYISTLEEPIYETTDNF